MKTSIVIGLCYGDEGKGLTTSFLSDEQSLVVRFNGGHQAGHTVEHNGYRHVFSSFSAGTLKDAHTYWSEYCTFCPKSFYNEKKALVNAGYTPIHYIHPLAMITTPFDHDHNKKTEKENQHGSVGVGFGATIGRHTNTPFKLFAIDLQYRPLLIHKLVQIASYYGCENPGEVIKSFLFYIDNIKLDIRLLSEIKDRYLHIIFEGAQGIMLDQDFGYFPNVTRSNTTSKNAMQIILDNDLDQPEIFYVMRSYLTRHGNGYMPNEMPEFCFQDKTNIAHEYQGRFRQGYHCSKMINHALAIDSIYSGKNSFSHTFSKNIVVTCLDQTSDMIMIDRGHVPFHEYTNSFMRKGFAAYYGKNGVVKRQNFGQFIK